MMIWRRISWSLLAGRPRSGPGVTASSAVNALAHCIDAVYVPSSFGRR